MLNRGQLGAVEESPITVDRSYHYDRFGCDGARESEITLTCHFGEPVTVIGHTQTLDELEVAIARLIERARKEVSRAG